MSAANLVGFRRTASRTKIGARFPAGTFDRRPSVDNPCIVTLSILHIAQPTEAGVARYVANLAAAQVAGGHNCVVASPRRGPLRQWLEDAGVAHAHWDARRNPGAGTIQETRRLARLIRSVNAEIVHLHSAKAGLAGRLAVRGKRTTLFQPHAWSFVAVTGLVRAATIRWERFGASWCDRIVCVSEAEERQGRRAGIDADYVTVTNGVDLGAWSPADEAKKAGARAALGIGREELVVLCPGRLSRQKGQDVLLAAWRKLAPNASAARLIFVGDGPEGDDLRRDAPAEAIFAGHQEDLAPWMHAADIVALPSRWEGMSLVLLEAMACGCSIVSTDVSGAREALGGAGGIVPVEHPEALARALSDRLRDPELRRRESGAVRKRAEENHDWNHVVDRMSALYEELLGHQ